MKTVLCAFLLIIGIIYVQAEDNATQVKPNDNENDAEICKLCHCNKEEKYVNCANLNLFRLFSGSSWKTVNTTQPSVLDRVEFDKNGIMVVTQFPELSIRSLSFKSNGIVKVEKQAFFYLKNLEILDLSFNKLTYAALHPEVFQGPYSGTTWEPLKSLKYLDLSNNDLHTLDPDIFAHLINLETLILSHNPFKVIDHNSASAISNIKQLTTLDMSAMELKTLPEHLFHAPSKTLKTLNLTGNLFETIPEAIGDATNLVHLNLDDNIIENFGGKQTTFPHLPKLETLSISYMDTLKSIDEGAFQNLAALQHFICQHNEHLSSIHSLSFGRPGKESKTREEWPPIRSLILLHNNLSMIDSDLIGRWDEVEEIDIRYNPWACECKNDWMAFKLIPQIMEKSKSKPTMYEETKCGGPIEMVNKSLHEIYMKSYQMRCEDYYGRRPERDGPILVGIFIGLLVGIPISMGIILAYKRGCFGLFGYRPSSNDYARAFYKRAGLSDDMHI